MKPHLLLLCMMDTLEGQALMFTRWSRSWVGHLHPLPLPLPLPLPRQMQEVQPAGLLLLLLLQSSRFSKRWYYRAVEQVKRKYKPNNALIALPSILAPLPSHAAMRANMSMARHLQHLRVGLRRRQRQHRGTIRFPRHSRSLVHQTSFVHHIQLGIASSLLLRCDEPGPRPSGVPSRALAFETASMRGRWLSMRYELLYIVRGPSHCNSLATSKAEADHATALKFVCFC